MCGRVLRRGVTLHRECCDSLVLLLEGTVQDVDSVVVVCVLESVGAVHGICAEEMWSVVAVVDGPGHGYRGEDTLLWH